MSALETYLPLAQLFGFMFAWCAAMITGLVFRAVL